MITKERKQELFNGLLDWVWEHTENLFEGNDHDEYIRALENCGFTEEEIDEIIDEL